MKFKTIIFLFAVLMLQNLSAQELKMTVKITAPNLQFADPRVFETLEREISEFYNSNKWTDDEFEDEEKIECYLTITIVEELSATDFKGDFYYQSTRPVYNSDYSTSMLNYVEKGVSFSYNELQPLRKSDNIYVDNLSSILTFYSYIILGLDYDSFSPYGGEPFFKITQNIINLIPPGAKSIDKSWEAFGQNFNRYFFSENLNNTRVKKLRKELYEYHRNGLDIMHENADKAKAIMLATFKTALEVEKDYPNNMYNQVLLDTKRDEIIEIFKDATSGQQKKIYDILVELNPAQADRYSEIK